MDKVYNKFIFLRNKKDSTNQKIQKLNAEIKRLDKDVDAFQEQIRQLYSSMPSLDDLANKSIADGYATKKEETGFTVLNSGISEKSEETSIIEYVNGICKRLKDNGAYLSAYCIVRRKFEDELPTLWRINPIGLITAAFVSTPETDNIDVNEVRESIYEAIIWVRE